MLVKYNTSLLKVNDNLIKCNSKTIYEFNLNRFDTETLTDGIAQWECPSGTRKVTLTKRDNYLEMLFTEGTKQYFDLLNTFGLYTDITDFIIELSYSGNFPYRSFFGFLTFSFSSPGRSNYFDYFWRYYNTWGSVSGSGVPVDYKFHIKSSTDSNILTVDVYKDEQFILTSQCKKNQNTIITHNVDYNGVSRYGTINLHKLKIYTL